MMRGRRSRARAGRDGVTSPMLAPRASFYRAPAALVFGHGVAAADDRAYKQSQAD